jgi:hypothetical protein
MLRSIMRPLTEDEMFVAVEGAIAAVCQAKGFNFTPNVNEVVGVTVAYSLMNGAPNPIMQFDCHDKRTKEIIGIVTHWLRYDYTGVAEYGLLERVRFLESIARK